MKSAVVCVMCLLMAGYSWAMPLNAQDHVPPSSCHDMVPLHGNYKPSNLPSPYSVKPVSLSAAPGEIVRVHLTGSKPFKGVYLQARQGDQPVGEFVLHEGNSDKLSLSDCPPGKNNAVTLASSEDFNELTVGWKVPKITGDIVFRATFVKSFSEFWVGMESSKVHIEASSYGETAMAA